MHAFFIFNRNEARILTNNSYPLHVRMFPESSVFHFLRLKSGQVKNCSETSCVSVIKLSLQQRLDIRPHFYLLPKHERYQIYYQMWPS